MSTISIITTLASDGRIAKYGLGRSLWYIPDDLRRFKSITEGDIMIMTAKTYESILKLLGKPLPNRTNIVITRTSKYKNTDCLVFPSLEQGIKYAQSLENKEIFIMGGISLYKKALPYVQRLYLTIIHGTYKANHSFPDYSDFSHVIMKEQGNSGGYLYTFLILEKHV